MEQQGGAVGATFADPSGGPGVLKADPANLMLEDAGNSAVHTDAENKALQLAEGKVSASEAASIAAGGTGDDSDRSNDAPAAAVEAKEESDLADLPSANIAPADFASSEGGSASGGRKSHAAQALHRVHKIKGRRLRSAAPRCSARTRPRSAPRSGAPTRSPRGPRRASMTWRCRRRSNNKEETDVLTASLGAEGKARSVCGWGGGPIASL
ncbi:hypothetical protein T484DRAFT_2436444 [Baffinella frigidus]|nr:hypothetical protein T484DRAFT_2436444 [Cryptophyta sp. CCMP2293]